MYLSSSLGRVGVALSAFFYSLSVRVRYLARRPGVIRLPSGVIAHLRRLRLYELDSVEYNDPGPYKHPYKTASGAIVYRDYDLSAWKEPPKAPDTPEHECDEGSYEWGLYQIYNMYAAALAQQRLRVEASETWATDVGRYIIENCIIQATGPIETSEDYEAIYAYVLVPEVRMEDIERSLRSVFQGYLWQRPGTGHAVKEATDRQGAARFGQAVGRQSKREMAVKPG